MNTTTKIPVVILVRVSTKNQETDRQVSELVKYSESKGYNVVEICKETISGAADSKHRHGLTEQKSLQGLEPSKKYWFTKYLGSQDAIALRTNSLNH